MTEPYYQEDNIMIYNGDCLEVLKQLPSESVDCVMTSPPYWALRDYSVNPQIWDGDKNCEHEWYEVDVLRKATPGDKPSLNSKIAIHRSNNENRPGKPSDFCIKCGAWRGALGLEPTFQLYIKHLCDIFDEVKRVLKKTGNCWVNMGDTYGGSGGSHKDTHKNNSGFQGKYRRTVQRNDMTDKCLLQISSRFAIEICNRSWILRNEII